MLKTFLTFSLVLLGGLLFLPPGSARAAEKTSPNENTIVIAKSHNHENPCGAANPCMMKNPCAMMMNPCSMKNPCRMANPCSTIKPIRKKALKSKKQALKYGKRLWKNKRLGTAGVSCASCHPKGANLKSKPYPRYINMPSDVVTLDQMINFCMVNPMKGEALKWNSKRLTALNAYVQELAHKNDHHKNPCMMMNPCSMKNPCAMKNPCSGY